MRIMSKVVKELIKRNEKIATMESCTGGYISSQITNEPNSSKIFEMASVTYSYEAKIKMGVSKETIDAYTVYSFEVAKEMAKCISDYSSADYGIGVTGQVQNKGENVYISIYLKNTNKYLNFNHICKANSKFKNKIAVSKLIEQILLEKIFI